MLFIESLHNAVLCWYKFGGPNVHVADFGAFMLLHSGLSSHVVDLQPTNLVGNANIAFLY